MCIKQNLRQQKLSAWNQLKTSLLSFCVLKIVSDFNRLFRYCVYLRNGKEKSYCVYLRDEREKKLLCLLAYKQVQAITAELTQLKNGKKQRQDSTIEEINPKMYLQNGGSELTSVFVFNMTLR